jgi:peptidoglycan glycosyltransferase
MSELLGTGVGRGMPDLIPVVASDFIFVASAEEMGLFGAAGVLICYVLFAVRGLSIAARARSDIDAFTAAGLTASILLQAFVIVGGVTQLIPLTGVTLPFMSQGGSSLLASFIIVGLLLRAGDSSTGLATELVSAPTLDGGVLGRLALGKRLTVLITVFACLFALLIANLTWHMVVQAGSVQAMAANNHTIAREQGAQRGAIYTADGVVLAQSVESADGSYLRDYPEGSLAAHVIGYSSVQYGSSGIEATQQQVLRGESGFTSWSDAINAAAGRQIPGNDVQLTIDSRLQKAAESALQGQTGAAVILDAQTGAVLGMASSPAYDVNDVAALLDSNDASGNSELYNRATQALYAPGSTFKIVTLAGGLDSAGLTLDSRFDAPGTMDIGNAPVTNFNRTDYGELSLLQGFEHSSNTVFAQVADRMGPRNLVNTADRFGFDRLFGRDFTVARSLMPNPDEMTEWETAWAGAGMPVGEHESAAGPQATVIQMALVSAAIANDGVIMDPYLTARVTSPNGTVIQTTQPEVFESQAASPATIASIREAMAGVVQSGTGTSAQVPGYTVRGKTGTAETGKAADDSWFSGYIEVGDRRIDVALVLEQAGSGAATPKAGGLFEAAVAVYAG